MSKPRLLDLFCGGGGAARGYQQAGFHVIGVDNLPQPNYIGDNFFECDAIEALRDFSSLTRALGRFDAIHASPPCQDHSVLSSRSPEHRTGWMLAETIRLLDGIGLPFVVENVPGSGPSMGGQWITLCGSSFGLKVRRHRLFRSSILLMAPSCNHRDQPEPIDVTGLGGPGGRHRKPTNLAHAREAMGIDWMTRAELSQAVPPAYTRFIGEQLLLSL